MRGTVHLEWGICWDACGSASAGEDGSCAALRAVWRTARRSSRMGGTRRVDEETLVARVRSEIFRDAPLPAGMVNIDAYEGCVTLRGQLPNEGDMRRLVAATKRVEGVTEVRSYLHLPDELPPNKAEMYEHSEPHLPSL